MSKNNGIEIIQQTLQNMPESTGIYQMIGADDVILYIGKAKNLKKRVTSYTKIEQAVYRIQKMIMQVVRVEIITTNTEVDALLLEANLIKNLKPRYNILLKDDKSFPYITITGDHDYPRITKHRGKKHKNSTYFGPFVCTKDVNEAISVLQKAFLLRPCANSVFANAHRPCMEYQIKRCSAPCVDKISLAEYSDLVLQTKQFLQGKNAQIQKNLQAEMDLASQQMNYEKAVIYRDRMQALTTIQTKQSINSQSVKEADIIAITTEEDKISIQIFFLRNGQILGGKAYFPYQTQNHDIEDILEAFIGNFYQTNIPPKQIFLNIDLYSKTLLEQALSQIAPYNVKISIPQKGEKRQMIDIAITNAKSALTRKIQAQTNESELLRATAEIFNITQAIKRIEVFDNSHIFGSHAVGAMIVSTLDGFAKNEYRKFNVDSGEKNTGGDDLHMMRQVLERRYRKVKDNPESTPDLILIDGGAGHLQVAKDVFNSLELNIPFICIAKGRQRNAGREDYYTIDKPPFKLDKESKVGYFMQRLRDEAHNFAISSHRQKRNSNTIKSQLDDISGVGATRKHALLNHFGSVKNISKATIEQLMTVSNINKKTAQIIVDYFQ